MTHAGKSDPIERAERAGRKGDRLLGHLTPGDVIVPRGRVTPELRALLSQHFDVDTYTAGHEKNSTNPKTGLPEFADGMGDGSQGDFGGSDGTGGASDGVGGGADSGAATSGGLQGAIDNMMGMIEAANKGDIGALAGYAGPGNVSPNTEFGPNATPTGLWDAIKGFFEGNATPGMQPDSAFSGAGVSVNSAQGDSGNGNILDSTMPRWLAADAGILPLNPQGQMAPQVVPQSNVNPLLAPQAPQVPQTPADVGRYYGALLGNDTSLANALLGPYLSGNKNIYGR